MSIFKTNIWKSVTWFLLLSFFSLSILNPIVNGHGLCHFHFFFHRTDSYSLYKFHSNCFSLSLSRIFHIESLSNFNINFENFVLFFFRKLSLAALLSYQIFLILFFLDCFSFSNIFSWISTCSSKYCCVKRRNCCTQIKSMNSRTLLFSLWWWLLMSVYKMQWINWAKKHTRVCIWLHAADDPLHPITHCK